VEKQTAPTKEMMGPRFGTAMATTTGIKQGCQHLQFLPK
jgi:hypothetical protein